MKQKRWRQILAALLLAVLLAASSSACGAAPGQEPLSPAFRMAADARVSYLGPAGTYTEEAARFFFFPNTSSLIPEATVPAAIADVAAGRADFALIPQENTIGGAVTYYVDALMAERGIFVVGEVILPISQTLMGVPGASLDEIRLVCSHAQGLAQSAEWRQAHLPGAQTREMDSTAAAASFVAETGDKTIAAIAAPGAAGLYGLTVLAENVQITLANKTRFYVLAAAPAEEGSRTHAVFVAECEANRLDDIILALRKADLELVTIHDRPEGSQLGTYRYLIEVENENGISEKTIGKVERIKEIQCLGSFNVVEKVD